MIFHKLNGLANDFVLIDQCTENKVQDLKVQTIQKMANRKQGVGFDQLLILRPWANPKNKAMAELQIFNADGSLAEMCGNGLRAAALYWFKKNPQLKKVTFQTAAGLREAKLLKASSGLIQCQMGVPVYKKISNKSWIRLNQFNLTTRLDFVNVGNPHLVLWCWPKNLAQFKLWGDYFENHRRFKNRTNVHFVKEIKPGVVAVRVWERGVGHTLACGTGAVAVAVSYLKKMSTPKKIKKILVEFEGGQAWVEWPQPQRPAWLTAVTEYNFRGEIAWRF